MNQHVGIVLPFAATQKRTTMLRNLLSLIAITLLLTSTCSLQADFVDGVETFDGTTLDTVTWESHAIDTISQNDELIFTNPRLRVTEHVTRLFGIRSGERVQAEVTLDSYSTAGGSVKGFAALVLTDNLSGSSNWFVGDDNYAALELSDSTNVLGSQIVASSQAGGPIIHNFGPTGTILGQTYLLELERLNAIDVRYAAYELDGSLIAETTRALALPNEAFISLTSNGSARFDNVTVVPEPASTMVLAGLFLFGAIGRRRNQNS